MFKKNFESSKIYTPKTINSIFRFANISIIIFVKEHIQFWSLCAI